MGYSRKGNAFNRVQDMPAAGPGAAAQSCGGTAGGKRGAAARKDGQRSKQPACGAPVHGSPHAHQLQHLQEVFKGTSVHAGSAARVVCRRRRQIGGVGGSARAGRWRAAAWCATSNIILHHIRSLTRPVARPAAPHTPPARQTLGGTALLTASSVISNFIGLGDDELHVERRRRLRRPALGAAPMRRPAGGWRPTAGGKLAV